jgi:hypothetical protein
MSNKNVFLSDNKKHIHIQGEISYRIPLRSLTAKPVMIDPCIIRIFYAYQKIVKIGDIEFDSPETTSNAFSVIMDLIPRYLFT